MGEPPEDEKQAAAVEQAQEDGSVAATIEDVSNDEEPVEITEAEAVSEPAVEPAAAAAPEIVTVSLETEQRPTIVLTPAPQSAAPAETEAEETPAADARGIGEIWTVTGSTVNLRAGATTQATVLGRTKRGDSAEVMELLDNGWAKVYILETGLEAYMSAQFLAREDG